MSCSVFLPSNQRIITLDVIWPLRHAQRQMTKFLVPGPAKTPYPFCLSDRNLSPHYEQYHVTPSIGERKRKVLTVIWL